MNDIREPEVSGSLPLSAEATALTALLDVYTNTLSTLPISQNDLSAAGSAWIVIADFVIAHPAQDVLALIWTYYLANHGGVLSQTVVMRCVATLDQATEARAILFYSLFQITANGIDVCTATLDGAVIQPDALGAPSLVAFLRALAPTAVSSTIGVGKSIATAQPGPAVTLLQNVIVAVNTPYQFSVASTQWSIVHNRGRFPVVSITDPAGNVIPGDIRYIDANSLVITFATATSGTAYLT